MDTGLIVGTVVIVLLAIGLKFLITKVAKTKGENLSFWIGAVYFTLFCGFFIWFNTIQRTEAKKQETSAQLAIEQAEENAKEARIAAVEVERVKQELKKVSDLFKDCQDN